MKDPESNYWNKLSPEVKRILRLAEAIASNAKMKQVTAAHIMLALIRTFPLQVSKKINRPLGELRNSLEHDYIYNYNLTRLKFVISAALIRAEHETVKLHHLIEVTSNYISGRRKPLDIDQEEIRRRAKSTPKNILISQNNGKQKPDLFLNRLGRDLTQLAIADKLHPIIGRDKEINLAAETLCRVFKRNPLLVGPAGVGKTAIVEGLAQRLESEDIAPELKKKRIIEMDVGNLVKGTKYRGELEKKIMQVIDRVKNSNFIIFIDELHTLMGAGLAEGTTLDVTSMLLPSLARGEISCIGATTDYNYHKFIEKDKAFERRFQPIRIPELSSEDTLRMLKKIGPIKFEKPKNIEIDEKAYHASLDLAGRYMRNRYFPDKAIDIIDHAVGRAIRKKNKKVTVSDIKNIMGSLTGLPIGKLEDELKNKLKGLNSHLKEHILGQDHVADIVADTIWPKTLGADLHPERPNGVFLFLGPTGVGKTEFARELARYLFGSLNKLIRIDMSEYSEAHTVAKLLGAPFGYRGHEKGSPVLNEIEENPFSILLLDEFEKAHPEIHKLFLQVFDSGVLTDTDRHHVYFSDVIIIMTSNISVEHKPSVGFVSEEKTKQVQDEMTKYFAPEFVNRIDYICLFNRLSKKTAENIVKTRIFPLVEEKWIEKGFKISVKPEVISFIVDQGYSEKWGARNLERTVDKLISSPLAKFMQRIEKKEKKKIEISIKNGSIQIS